MLLVRRGRLVRTARVMAMRRRGGRKALGLLGDESEVQHQRTYNQAAEPACLHSRIITDLIGSVAVSWTTTEYSGDDD